MPAVEGLGIADVAVFVVLLFIVGALWILLQARGPISGVPVVGAPGVDLIDGMRKTLTDWAMNVEGFLTSQQVQAQATWNAFVNNIMAPALAAIGADLTWRAGILHALILQLSGANQLAIQDLQAFTHGTLQPELTQLEATVQADATYVRDVIRAELTQAEGQLVQTQQAVAQLEGRAFQLEQQLQGTMNAVTTLLGFLPLLQALAAFEATASGGVIGLQREYGLTQQQLQELRDQLGKLLALSGVAALGAVAVANLVRVARDPCSACQGIALPDLEARLELVEAFGET